MQSNHKHQELNLNDFSILTLIARGKPQNQEDRDRILENLGSQGRSYAQAFFDEIDGKKINDNRDKAFVASVRKMFGGT